MHGLSYFLCKLLFHTSAGKDLLPIMLFCDKEIELSKQTLYLLYGGDSEYCTYGLWGERYPGCPLAIGMLSQIFGECPKHS